jgi:S1-C subfamily serine protease
MLKWVQTLVKTVPSNTGAVRLSIDELSIELKGLIGAQSFSIHPEKSWWMGRTARKMVCGLVVNEKVNVPRKFINRTRSQLHSLKSTSSSIAGERFNKKYPEKTGSFLSSLSGNISWIGQVRGHSDPVYRRLATDLNQIINASLPIGPTLDELLSGAVWILESTFLDKEGKDDFAQGTAFKIKDVGWITAEHNVPSTTKKITLVHPNELSKEYDFTIEKKNEISDIAIISACGIEPKVTGLAVSNHFSKGNEVFACGFPNWSPGKELIKRKSEVEQIYPRSGFEILQMSADFVKGMSGGPVVDKDMKVIGIIHKGTSSGAADGINIVSEASSIRNLSKF